MKSAYPVEELVGLPGMTKTSKGIYDRIKAGTLKATARKNADGSDSKFMIVALSDLPAETRKHLTSKHLDAVAANLPAERGTTLPIAIEPAPLPALTSLTKHQVAVMDARLWFIRLIENRAKGQSIKKCQHEIAASVVAGKHPYCQMATIANDRQGQDRTLSSRTLMRWWSELWLTSGKNAAALAPNGSDALRVARETVLVAWCRDYKPGQRMALPQEIPAWLPYFLDIYRNPNKPFVSDALRDLRDELPPIIPIPSYDQIMRICDKIPAVYLQKYRMTGAEYRAICGYHSRDFSMDDPFTVGQIDGHSFKSYVAHPTTGAHFHPEVCGIICMTSKVMAGFSVGVAESAQTVADAVRHACTINEKKPWGGLFAIIEADRGTGNLAKVNTDELTGRFSRLNIEFIPPEHGGNPQGHGGVERSNQTVWIKAAKKLVTYTGKDMDRCVRKKIYTKLEKDLKAAEKAGKLGAVDKTSKLLLSWQEFIDFLNEWVIQYNNTPHSSLPKINDPKTGKRRHMSPFEYLASRMAEGWQPVKIPQDMLEHLFMPHEEIDVKRRMFTLRGNRYHAYELHQYHGQKLIAAYDIHDAHYVWVMDRDERLICKATWNGNKVTGQPTPVKEQAIQKRADGQIKLLHKQIDLREAETREAVVIEHSPAVRAKLAPVPSLQIAQEPQAAPVIAPVFSLPPTQAGKYNYWCQIDGRISSGEEVSEAESRFHTHFQKSTAWESERMYDPAYEQLREER